MKKVVRIVILAVVLGAAGLVVYVSLDGKRGDDGRLKVNGQIETTEVDLSFKLSGIVQKMLVDEGMSVKRGQVIAVLEHQDLLDQRRSVQAKLAQARASLASAAAALRLVLAGTRVEAVAQAKAKVNEAESKLWNAARNWQRFRPLYKVQVISGMTRDQARAEYLAAAAALKQAQENYLQLKNGARPEEIDQARANVAVAQAAAASAEAELALIQTRLTYCTIRSPIDGYVLVKSVEQGEFVTAGTPLCTVGRLDLVKFITYVPETDLGRVKLGQRVLVTTDTYPDKRYPGRVVFISNQAEFTPKNVQTQKERVKLVFKVKIHLPNPRRELKPGMPADGVIVTEAAPRAAAGSRP